MCVCKSLYEHTNVQNILSHIFIPTHPTALFFKYTIVCNHVKQIVT